MSYSNCNTLYINNLNEKIKLDPLKEALRAVFAQFGEIVDIIAMSSLKRRGQAFIVFRSMDDATKAMQQMQGFPLFDKPMRINFAKSKSDSLAKLDGTFVIRPKKVFPKKMEAVAPVMQMGMVPGMMPGMIPPNMAVPAVAPVPMKPRKKQVLPPNRTLFCENLPPNMVPQMLEMLFSRFRGYTEVRLVAEKCVAFIEFIDAISASSAMNELDGYSLTPQHQMIVNFAKA
eukprot:TRINITY_DN779980_c0_g1_i1.p1 TRINITY_DN779980_c0_g1~~TRINITY_DN779980_c0_g1_i1.p1  ORF type:complete len:230 (-),score=63.05 TRINITY_DN779980_c0_g1_i1:152-841(-)